MESIAREGQVAKATLFSHFPDKEAAFRAVSEWMAAQLSAAFEGYSPKWRILIFASRMRLSAQDGLRISAPLSARIIRRAGPYRRPGLSGHGRSHDRESRDRARRSAIAPTQDSLPGSPCGGAGRC